MCDQTNSHVSFVLMCADSIFIRVTWHIHMRHRTHSPVGCHHCNTLHHTVPHCNTLQHNANTSPPPPLPLLTHNYTQTQRARTHTHTQCRTARGNDTHTYPLPPSAAYTHTHKQHPQTHTQNAGREETMKMHFQYTEGETVGGVEGEGGGR